MQLSDLQKHFTHALVTGELTPAFLESIAPHPLTAQQRLGIYQNSLRATLYQALQETYPVMQQFIGDTCFEQLGKAFIHTSQEWPHNETLLEQYGAGLAAFIETQAQLAEWPYLSDLARLEWAIKGISRLPQHKSGLSLQDFAGLSEHDQAACSFQLAPATILQITYPVDQCWQWAVYDAPQPETISVADDLFYLFIWYNKSGTLNMDRVSENDYILLQALKQAPSLAEIAESLPAAVELATSLPRFLQQGYIINIIR